MEDKGHTKLIIDIQNLLKEVHTYEFNDFKNSRYAFPKIELVSKLEAMIGRTKNGDYDN